MLDEDTIIKDARNSNERLLIVNILCVVLLPAILFGGSSDLFVGLFTALGVVAPINILNYINSWSKNPQKDYLRFFAFLTPYIATFTILVLSVANPSLLHLTFENGEYLQLSKATNTPTNSFGNILVPISAELVCIAAFLAGLSIYLITDSRFVIRKILIWTSLSITILMVLGCFVVFMWNFDGDFFSKEDTAHFSTFADASQWAAFGLLWMSAALAVAIHAVHRFRMYSFVYSIKFLGLITAFAIFVGVLIAGKTIHIFFAFLIMAVGLSMIAFEVVPAQFNVRRHEMLRHLTSHAKRKAKMLNPFICYAICAIACWYGAFCGANKMLNDTKTIFVDANNKSTITYAEKMALYEDAKKMIDDNHLLFGYGTASFPNAFAFFQGSDLGTEPWASPNSDLLHKLIENGVVGLTLSAIVFVVMLLRWLLKHNFSKSGMIMMLAIFAILAISIVEIPFQSTAVLVSFWVIAMSVFRWDDAKIN